MSSRQSDIQRYYYKRDPSNQYLTAGHQDPKWYCESYVIRVMKSGENEHPLSLRETILLKSSNGLKWHLCRILHWQSHKIMFSSIAMLKKSYN